jgi:hypothetical protein
MARVESTLVGAVQLEAGANSTPLPDPSVAAQKFVAGHDTDVPAVVVSMSVAGDHEVPL